MLFKCERSQCYPQTKKQEQGLLSAWAHYAPLFFSARWYPSSFSSQQFPPRTVMDFSMQTTSFIDCGFHICGAITQLHRIWKWILAGRACCWWAMQPSVSMSEGRRFSLMTNFPPISHARQRQADYVNTWVSFVSLWGNFHWSGGTPFISGCTQGAPCAFNQDCVFLRDPVLSGVDVEHGRLLYWLHAKSETPLAFLFGR